MEKIKSYNLIIDQDRNDILAFLANTGLTNEKFQALIRQYNLSEALTSLLKELNKKEHDADMCTDPKCGYEKK